MHRLILLSVSAVVIAGCQNPANPEAEPKAEATAKANSAAASQPGAASPAGASSQPAAPSSQPGAASQPSSRPAQTAATARAEAGQARLQASEAGKILLSAIDAQGGLQAWFDSGALRFHYDYQPKKGARRRSLQTVDLLGSRAYHDLQDPAKGRIAFDGKQAWMKLEGDAKFAARFWALTPYYFVGMPFVLSDAGVRLALIDDDPAAAGLEPSHVIKATFEPGTGDAPDDYYVVYISKKTKRLLALRYVVTYAPFFEGKATKSTAEKLLVYEAPTKAGPLSLATTQRFFAFADGKKGDEVTVATVSDITYGAPFDEARLVAPEGAKIDEAP